MNRYEVLNDDNSEEVIIKQTPLNYSIESVKTDNTFKESTTEEVVDNTSGWITLSRNTKTWTTHVENHSVIDKHKKIYDQLCIPISDIYDIDRIELNLLSPEEFQALHASSV